MNQLKNILPFRWLLLIIVATALSVSISSCGDDDDDDSPEGGRYPLTGTWLDDEVHTDFQSGEPYQFKYVFNQDGSGTACYTRPGARVDAFTDYMIKDGKLYIKWNGDDDFDEKGEIVLIDAVTFRISFDGDEWNIFRKQ